MVIHQLKQDIIRTGAAYGIKHVRSVLVIIHTAGFTFRVNVKTEIILSFTSSVVPYCDR